MKLTYQRKCYSVLAHLLLTYLCCNPCKDNMCVCVCVRVRVRVVCACVRVRVRVRVRV